MKASVDRDLCIGCGLCGEICPPVFAMGADMISVVIGDMIPATAESCARDAAAACPVSAITISE